MDEADITENIERTAAIVAAYVSHNAVPTSELPGLIAAVYGAFARLGVVEPEPVAIELKPAVPINKSVFADRIISLETGQGFKSLKRHLGTLGLTPAEYRAKWGLPSDYPMTCPDYSKTRASIAKATGLGVSRPQLAA